jgi:2,5-diamino-6-(ribosylamino)-4(3H)-pyrimidinone 5'-phosphate reductase
MCADHRGMLPTVVLHNAVSADGRTAGFGANLGLFHEIAGRWHEDVTLAGSDTILAALRHGPDEAETNEMRQAAAGARSGVRLAVIDSRGRIKDWRRIKTWPFWDSFLSISSSATPGQHLAYLSYQDVDNLTVGERRVDLGQALEAFSNRYGAKTVRVESGGTLGGELLRQGLVNEVSLLLHPLLVGGMSPPTIYRTLELDADSPVTLKLLECQKLQDAFVWLRYEVTK